MPARPCCQLSELLGIFYGTRGRLIGHGDGQAAYFSLLRNIVARKVVRLARTLGGIECKYQAVRSAKRMAFFIELPLPAGMVPPFAPTAARSLPGKPCAPNALLRGGFLRSGPITAPTPAHRLDLVS